MAMLAGPRQRKRYNLVPKGKALFEDGDRFGTKMLEKMGWSKGKGLGAKESGQQEFIRIRYKNDANGLGYEDRDDQWTEHEKQFNGLLESLHGGSSNSNTAGSADDGDESAPRVGFGFQTNKTSKEKLKDKISGQSLEERSKTSKARVHYKKFTKGKDMSQYSEKDLANIFGKKATEEENDFYSQLPSVKAGSEGEGDDGEKKPTFDLGTHTINTGLSVGDYFKMKMDALKNRKSTNVEEKKEEIENGDEVIDVSDAEDEAEVGRKKKKKSKKQKNEDGDVEENGPQTTENKEDQDEDMDSQGQGEEESERSQKKKKKSKKRKNEDDAENGNSQDSVPKEMETEGEEVEAVKDAGEQSEGSGKKKKSKKQKKQDEDDKGTSEFNGQLTEATEEEVIDITIDAEEESEGSRKKKKKSKKQKSQEENANANSDGKAVKGHTSNDTKEEAEKEQQLEVIDVTSDAEDEAEGSRKTKKKSKKPKFEDFPEERIEVCDNASKDQSDARSKKKKSKKTASDCTDEQVIAVEDDISEEPRPKKKKKAATDEPVLEQGVRQPQSKAEEDITLQTAETRDSCSKKKKGKKTTTENLPEIENDIQLVPTDALTEETPQKKKKNKKRKAEETTESLEATSSEQMEPPMKKKKSAKEDPATETTENPSKKQKNPLHTTEPPIDSGILTEHNSKKSKKNKSQSSDTPISNDKPTKVSSLHEISRLTDYYHDTYKISTFCAEKFRNVDLESFRGSSISQLNGYGLSENLDLQIVAIDGDQDRITKLWSGTSNKYQLAVPKQEIYRNYMTKAKQARRQKKKIPKMRVERLQRLSAFKLL